MSVMLWALGLLGTVELMSLGVTIYNARKVGRDPTARTRANEAVEQAQYAHRKLKQHRRDQHGERVAVAEPDGGSVEAADELEADP